MNKYPIIIIAGISVLFSFVSVAHSTTYDYDSLNRLVRVTYDSGCRIGDTYINGVLVSILGVPKCDPK